jgi:hypothetical protein
MAAYSTESPTSPETRQLMTTCQNLLRISSALIAGGLVLGSAAYSQGVKPSAEDVDRAIHACSAGTKTDAAIEGGLNVLKQRIGTGEGKFSYSEIASVIGGPVQADSSKLELFDRIQKCVIDHVYGSVPKIFDRSPASLPSIERAQGASAPVHISMAAVWWDVSLYRCANNPEKTIICYFIFKKLYAGVSDYKANIVGKPRLVDNFQMNHEMTRAYFINGRNQEQDVIPLGKDESAWLALEFKGGETNITRLQIVLRDNVFTWPIKS